MKVTGVLLVMAGIALLLVAFYGIDTAPERTYNIGLLQGQMMVFQLGGVAFLAGVILNGFGHLARQLDGRHEHAPEQLAARDSQAMPLAATQANDAKERSQTAQALWFGGAIIALAIVGTAIMVIYAGR